MKIINLSIILILQIAHNSASADETITEIKSKHPSETNSVGNSKISYDSRACHSNANKMVYFAAGKTVFRVPNEDLLYIRGLSDLERNELPVRRDTSEPEGCPDNPIWGRSFRVRLASVSVTGGNVDAISVNIVARPPGNKMRYDRANMEFERAKSNPNIACKNSAHDFAVCEYPLHKYGVSGDFGPKVYQAKPEYYKTPLGEHFAISCSSLLRLDEQEHKCEVAYDINNNISVFYNFYRSKHPISKAADLDREILQLISNSIIDDYQWPK